MHPRAESDRTLPRRLRARRWAYDGTREAFASTAHAGFEIGWLDAGALRYRVGTRVLEATPGAAVLIPVGVEHATEFVGPMRGASVHLDDGLVLAVAEAAGVDLPAIPMLLDDGAALIALGRLVHEELARDAPEARLCADALAEALAARLLSVAAPARAPLDARVRRAVEHIHASFAEPLDVDEIAAAAGTSRFHLSRLFVSALGTSPYQYLLDLRLDEAARRLRRGRSVTDAALSSGFSDLSRFARMFQRRFGTRPSQYGGSGAPHGSRTAARSSSSMAPSAVTS
ncbi:MAG: helix-turn-helix transcriptional regulator [Deltaproteobacteria bacterium]|nr:helix-turn-helix transcriptional regulator [Deltaproteobacteria bacterium]